MIVTAQGILREYLFEKLGDSLGRHAYCMGWLRGEELVAALGFSRFSETNAEVSIYSERLIPRQLLDVGFRYTFGQLGLSRLTFCIRSDNIRCIELVSRLGAELEATLAGTHSDCDTQIWVLRPDSCNYWRRLNGQEGKRAPTGA